MEPIRFSIMQYEHRPKSNDWYWTVGAIALVLGIWRFLVADYMFGIFIVLSGLCMILLGSHKPQEMEVVIDEEAISVGENLYLWANVAGYAIVVAGDRTTLLLETNRRIVPVISIEVPSIVDMEVLHNLLVAKSTEKELQPSRSQAFMHLIGF